MTRGKPPSSSSSAARVARSVLGAFLLGPLLLTPTLLPAQKAPIDATGGASRAGADVAATIARYGLRPIDPPVPARDLTLPRMNGGEAALSDYQGRWVLLTFFATWCGPCRTEMPSLEAVHQQRADDTSMVVLGISIDDTRAPLENYLRAAGVTFPILWDGQGVAARAYQASSIPLSYIIDPRGQLVAVSRGARDWTTSIPMFDQLAAGVPSGDETDGTLAYSAPDRDDLELPSTLTPPTGQARLVSGPATVGEPFVVEVDLQWAGNFEDYLPHPPTLALPEGLTQENVAATTSSRDGRSRVTYSITLRAQEAGSYALDPVELSYTPLHTGAAPAAINSTATSAEGTEAVSSRMATRIAGPTVEVREPTVAGMSPKTFALTAAGAVLGFGLAILGLIFWRRRGPTPDPLASVQAARVMTWQAHLDAARRHRMQGDPRAALLALAQLDAEAHGLGETEIDAVRYGGRAPAPEELDRLTRRAERWLDAQRPDPDAAARAALQEGDAR